jgi:hypothetical protein
LAIVLSVLLRFTNSDYPFGIYPFVIFEFFQRIQRNGARFIAGDYKSRHEGAVTNMLNDLDLPTLQDRRTNASLKHSTVFAHAVSSGRLFQLTIVSTKNEFLYWLVFETGAAHELVLFAT